MSFLAGASKILLIFKLISITNISSHSSHNGDHEVNIIELETLLFSLSTSEKSKKIFEIITYKNVSNSQSNKYFNITNWRKYYSQRRHLICGREQNPLKVL